MSFVETCCFRSSGLRSSTAPACRLMSVHLHRCPPDQRRIRPATCAAIRRAGGVRHVRSLTDAGRVTGHGGATYSLQSLPANWSATTVARCWPAADRGGRYAPGVVRRAGARQPDVCGTATVDLLAPPSCCMESQAGNARLISQHPTALWPPCRFIPMAVLFCWP
jgi:hypothetical protein